jgi:hypothetical protein
MAGSRREAWRRRSGAEKGREKGPLGPDSHQEHSGKLGSAGGAPTAANSAAVARRSAGRIGDGGCVSGDHGPIPTARRTRVARRGWGRARRRSGWRGTAARGDGRGTGSVTERKTEKRGRGREPGEERKEEEWRGVQGMLQGVFSASRRQEGGGLGSALRRTRSSSQPTGRRKQFLQKTP